MKLWAHGRDDDHRLQAWRRAVAEFGRRLELVSDDQWDLPTPCAEWTVADLADHVIGYQTLLPAELGVEIQTTGDRVESWKSVIAAAEAAYTAPGALDTPVSFGPAEVAARERLVTPVLDALIHSWDLARAIGADEALPADLCREVLEAMRPLESVWRIPEWYGDALGDGDDGAGRDVEMRLLRFVGRDA